MLPLIECNHRHLGDQQYNFVTWLKAFHLNLSSTTITNPARCTWITDSTCQPQCLEDVRNFFLCNVSINTKMKLCCTYVPLEYVFSTQEHILFIFQCLQIVFHNIMKVFQNLKLISRDGTFTVWGKVLFVCICYSQQWCG